MVDSKLCYIDASGYVHEFRNYSISGSSKMYQDVDGNGLTLYKNETYGDMTNCSLIKDSGGNYIVFDETGKMIRMIPAPCAKKDLSTARAIVVQYEDEKLVSVYDNNVADVKVLFNYTGDNISQILIKKSTEVLKYVEFSYGAGNVLVSRKKGNLIEKYTYDEYYDIAGLQYSNYLLQSVTSDETKCAAKIEYVNNSTPVKSVRIGFVDEGEFVEKSCSSFAFIKDENGAVTKTDVTNEKRICIEYMFNEMGEIVSTFEKKNGGLYTLQKEVGKKIPVDNGVFRRKN